MKRAATARAGRARRRAPAMIALAVAALLPLAGYAVARWWTVGKPRAASSRNGGDDRSAAHDAAAVPRVGQLEGLDPAVAAAIRDAVAAVEREPANGARWGELGIVYNAHRYLALADRCYARAGELDTRAPDWPHLRGVLARAARRRRGRGGLLPRRARAIAGRPGGALPARQRAAPGREHRSRRSARSASSRRRRRISRGVRSASAASRCAVDRTPTRRSASSARSRSIRTTIRPRTSWPAPIARSATRTKRDGSPSARATACARRHRTIPSSIACAARCAACRAG